MENKSFTFKIGGPAGSGIIKTGLIFSKTVKRFGFHVFNYSEYPSLIRGGHNVSETHFGLASIYSQEKNVDVLVALNSETIALHIEEMKNGGVIVYDPDQIPADKVSASNPDIILLAVPFTKLLAKIKASKLMENNVALGAAAALFEIDISILYSVIKDIFAHKGEAVYKVNQKSADEGYNFVKSKKLTLKAISSLEKPKQKTGDYALITGNEAVGVGAAAGGCRFYAAYPMTPSSSVLHFLAGKAKEVGMVVRHAEDEIGAINEAIGASFAGVKSMVGTSGGGFSLMVESVSLSGITETGLVILVSQRPGPATGMPTWTEQGELLFSIYAGHGEFPKIILAPGDVKEALVLSAKAQNLASLYQTPVIILLDKFLSESYQDINISDTLKDIPLVNFGKWDEAAYKIGDAVAYPRYKESGDGISPRIRPGTAGYFFQANSYEHLEDGHTSESAENRVLQSDKRSRKIATYLVNDYVEPKMYGADSTDITLVGWGSVKGPILEALMNNQNVLTGKSVNFLHFTHMYPMDKEKVFSKLSSCKKLVLIENNATGQLGKLISQETGIIIKEQLLKYNGRPFYQSEIIEFIKKL